MGLLTSIVNSRPFYIRRLHYAIMLVLLCVFIGVAGFMTIEGFTFFEAFYMTIITISTVGFGIIGDRELSPAGMMFTSFLIITNIGIFTYAVSIIAVFVVDGHFRKAFKELKIFKQVNTLKNHTIICGFGRNGLQAAEELYEHNQRFVIIESNTERIEKVKENHPDYLVVEGDATEDETLLKCGLNEATAIITTLPDDAANVFVTLTARGLNPRLNIISRASEETSEMKLRRAGADHIIMPEKIGGSHMAKMVFDPDIIEFFQEISGFGGVSINFEELDMHDIKLELKDKTIRDLEIRTKTGANIIGMKTESGKYIVNPDPNTKLDPEMKLIVLGDSNQLKAFRDFIIGL